MNENPIVKEKLIGKFRAEVYDEYDPEKRGRIKVICKRVNGDIPLPWAESCMLPGLFFLPNKKDYVWIEFEEGDIDKPIWVGIMPTKEYVRKKFFVVIDKYNPKERIIRTDVHEIRFYDNQKNRPTRDKVETSHTYIIRTVGHIDTDALGAGDVL
jgi:hypothetical protein